MSFAALISLKLTIQRILNSSQILISSSCQDNIELAYENVKSLQELFPLENGRNKERVKAVEKEIREASCRLEDVVESAHVSNQHFLSRSEMSPDGDEMSNLAMEVKEETNFFIGTVKKIKEQLSNTSLQPEEYEEAMEEEIPSRTHHFVATKPKIFGLDSDLIKLKGFLTSASLRLEIFSIVGMAGIGKTTLAKEVYEDPDMFHHFGCCAFVSIGQEYRFKEILLRILAQINPATKAYEIYEEQYAEYLYRCLRGRRYLIVLDDVWGQHTWDELRRYFPDDTNGSRILLTTRIEAVADYASFYALHKMQFLTEKDSWHLLCETVFGEEHSCPPQLEKPGKKIADKCEGLPLSIIVIGKHLSKAEMTPEYWSNVAEKESSNIIGADAEMSKVLYF
ncbi:putative late blight resistance proteinR1A-4 [Sesamum alatum]|uniref:Late blight resistance proteinR1A-4 n=1 Tax=Sesamum alatum TaxID=300844 RepID=A0AAE1YBB0_9LAMI|nr:putative late blight resistance proteinR1A-4 [Sesamum alatum]